MKFYYGVNEDLIDDKNDFSAILINFNKNVTQKIKWERIDIRRKMNLWGVNIFFVMSKGVINSINQGIIYNRISIKVDEKIQF